LPAAFGYRVSLEDFNGVEHAVEVLADSLYEV